MTKLLIVNNSMRQVSAANKLAPYIQDVAHDIDGVEATVLSLRDINLPFYNSPMTPAAPDYQVADEAARLWQRQVDQADAIVTLTPEYNHGMAASQKNAIDWLYHEWKDKPVVAIGYGWGGAKHALPHLNDVMRKVGANILADDAARLHFTKTVGLDGSVLDEAAAKTEILKAVQAAVAAVA